MGILDLFRRKPKSSRTHSQPTKGIAGPETSAPDIATILEWSREQARGKLLHPQHGELSFDASVMDADDLGTGESVAVNVIERRVTVLHRLSASPIVPSGVEVLVMPAGVFHLDTQTSEQRQRLGEALGAATFGHDATIDFYPSFIAVEGFETALTNSTTWHEVESRLAAFLDHYFGFDQELAAVCQGILGDLRQVQATVDKLERQGAPKRPFDRLFAVSARHSVDWSAVTSVDDDAFTEALAGLPGWFDFVNGTPHWYGSGEGLYPRLWAVRDESELRVGGMVPLPVWEEWFAAFEPLTRDLPRTPDAQHESPCYWRGA